MFQGILLSMFTYLQVSQDLLMLEKSFQIREGKRSVKIFWSGGGTPNKNIKQFLIWIKGNKWNKDPIKPYIKNV